MPLRKAFLLRMPDDLMEELNRWARDELRSANAQIEYLLRDAVRPRRKTSLGTVAPEPPDSGETSGEP